jgi:uncharacterized NAD(P)/FAD-binding protein YdhS
MRHIGIVGAGFTGTLLTVQLLRQSKEPLAIHLIDSNEFGAGVAYSTQTDVHILNSPAISMSPFPEDPFHFCRWIEQKTGINYPMTLHQRNHYRLYLQELLAESENHATQCSLHKIKDRTVHIKVEDGGYRLSFLKSSPLFVDQLILAMGHYPPVSPPQLTSPTSRYIQDVWASPGLHQIQRTHDVFILGTGLTMIDMVQQLIHMGHQGHIYALSRHGFLFPVRDRRENCFLPWSEASYDGIRFKPSLYEPPKSLPQEASSILRLARQEIQQLSLLGVDSRCVVSAFALQIATRDHKKLHPDVQRRLVRYLGSYGTAWLQGIPPIVSHMLEKLQHIQQLQIYKGRLQSLCPKGEQILVKMYTPTGHCELRADWVLNCTGPARRLDDITDPLIQQLRRDKLIYPNKWGYILQSAENGEIRPGMWTAGALQKNPFELSLTVQQIRPQVNYLAKLLV